MVGRRHQVLHQDEGLAGVLADGQETVILQNQGTIVAERHEMRSRSQKSSVIPS